ncbi:hypothetical protein [Spongiactinospora sp. TRM90649]|uniref:hypothetical protein n=1 Tax=Spongiactinospora sp. TRM90649 TaxID=3031114 RepID=UPI0023F6F131|nr:hypothetical protein [Spongiactinospora sp. TRM90649]MDF5759239.1 hypothetical protein [Spongiactinospora sp. TRM90649]
MLVGPLRLVVAERALRGDQVPGYQIGQVTGEGTQLVTDLGVQLVRRDVGRELGQFLPLTRTGGVVVAPAVPGVRGAPRVAVTGAPVVTLVRPALPVAVVAATVTVVTPERRAVAVPLLRAPIPPVAPVTTVATVIPVTAFRPAAAAPPVVSATAEPALCVAVTVWAGAARATRLVPVSVGSPPVVSVAVRACRTVVAPLVRATLPIAVRGPSATVGPVTVGPIAAERTPFARPAIVAVGPPLTPVAARTRVITPVRPIAATALVSILVSILAPVVAPVRPVAPVPEATGTAAVVSVAETSARTTPVIPIAEPTRATPIIPVAETSARTTPVIPVTEPAGTTLIVPVTVATRATPIIPVPVTTRATPIIPVTETSARTTPIVPVTEPAGIAMRRTAVAVSPLAMVTAALERAPASVIRAPVLAIVVTSSEGPATPVTGPPVSVALPATARVASTVARRVRAALAALTSLLPLTALAVPRSVSWHTTIPAVAAPLWPPAISVRVAAPGFSTPVRAITSLVSVHFCPFHRLGQRAGRGRVHHLVAARPVVRRGKGHPRWGGPAPSA